MADGEGETVQDTSVKAEQTGLNNPAVSKQAPESQTSNIGADAAPEPVSKPPEAEDPEATKNAQKAAMNVHAKVSTQALSVRQYLEATVVPILMQGMQSLVRERPPDAIEYLAAYLLKHNPSKKKKEEDEVKCHDQS